jgi:hypothetical protein
VDDQHSWILKPWGACFSLAFKTTDDRSPCAQHAESYPLIGMCEHDACFDALLVAHAIPRRPQRPRILHSMGPHQPPIPLKLHRALRKRHTRRRSRRLPALQGPIRRRFLVDIRRLSNNDILLVRLLRKRSASTISPYHAATKPCLLVLSTTEAAIDVLQRIHAKYPNDFRHPDNSSDALSIFRSGRMISPLAVEGLHLLGESYTKLRSYHARGVCFITLTHNCQNTYADAALIQLPDGLLAPSQPH